MPTVREVIRPLDDFAPPGLALDGDPAGLAFGDPDAPVRRALFSLEADEAALSAAREYGADFVACHHPRLYRPPSTLARDTFIGRLFSDWAASGVAVYAAHTALDLAPGGVADALADAVGLPSARTVFAIERRLPHWKLAVFVPDSHLEAVRTALAAAGAGTIGNYSGCSYRVKGVGTFTPEAKARPFIGTAGVREEVEEWRLEALVPERRRTAVTHALRAAHPYEEPAFDFIQVAESEAFGFGRAGDLAENPTLREWAGHARRATGSTETRILGDGGRRVRRAGVYGGSASGLSAAEARALALDAVAVGEMDYHALEPFAALGIGVVLLGHGWSERPGLLAWARHFRKCLPEVETRIAPAPAGAVNWEP